MPLNFLFSYRTIGYVFTFLLSLCFAPIGLTKTEFTTPVPPPSIGGKAHVLLDACSEQILLAEDEETPYPPASLTKIMTHYLVGEAIAAGQLKLDTLVSITQTSWQPKQDGESTMFLEQGDRPTVEQLIRGLVVSSGNDAATALAVAVSGNETAFVQRMNSTAERLGLKARFANAHGLPGPLQELSAKDAALLACAFIRDFPNLYPYYQEKSFRYNQITQSNRNGLLWDSSLPVDGIKTGHTKEAGYHLVASAQEGGQRLIAVSLGTTRPSEREECCRQMLLWGFNQFQLLELYPERTVLAKQPIYFGRSSSVPIGAERPVYVTLPKNRQLSEVRVTHEFCSAPLKAPLQSGFPVGEMIIQLDKQVLKRVKLVTLEATPKGGWLHSLLSRARLWMHQYLKNPWSKGSPSKAALQQADGQ